MWLYVVHLRLKEVWVFEDKMGPSRLANLRVPLPLLTREREQDTAKFREPTTVQTEMLPDRTS